MTTNYFTPWQTIGNRITDRNGDLVGLIAAYRTHTADHIAACVNVHEQLQAENTALKQRIADLEAAPIADHTKRAWGAIRVALGLVGRDRNGDIVSDTLRDKLLHIIAAEFAADARRMAKLSDETKFKALLGFAAYQQQAMRTAARMDNDQKMVNGIFGMAGETGELARLIMMSNPDLGDLESPVTRLLQLIATVGYVVDQVKKVVFQGHEPIAAMGYNNLLAMVRSAAVECMVSEIFDPINFACPALKIPNIDHVQDEAGDVLWYLAALATASELTLEEIAAGNLDKLQRRYGDVFSAEKSIKRIV